jgi:uncharacterized protein (TIGR02099 family)
VIESSSTTNVTGEPTAREPVRLRRRLFKWTAIAVGSFIALCFLVLMTFQVAVSRVPEYRVQLQDWVGEKTQLSIEFRKLNARLRLYGPELVFADVTVRSPDRTRVLATARGGSVALDIWNSLRAGRLTAGRFTLDSPQLGLIRTRDGRIQIAGQSALAEQPKPFALENLPLGRFRVRDALMSFQDEATGRGPWSLSGVDFTLVRDPERLEVEGRGSLPTTLGEQIEFSAHVAGALEAPQQVVSTVTLAGNALDLTGWADVLPDRWPAPESGRGSLQLTASFIGPELQSIVGNAQFNELTSSTPAWTVPLPTAAPLRRPLTRMHDPNGTQPQTQTQEDAAALTAAAVELPEQLPAAKIDAPLLLSYERVALDAKIERSKGGWKAHINSLELDAAESEARNKASDWQARDIEFAWAAPSDGALQLSGKADLIRLESVAPLLAYLPESEGLARLRALNLRGTVRDLVFSGSRQSRESLLTYSVAATTDAIGFDPVLKVPGFTGISGVLQADERQGEFKLDSGPMLVSIPWVFRWPLDANAVRAAVTWRDEGDAWHIGSDDLHFDAADGKGEARLSARVPRDGSSPRLDISARTRDMNAAATPKYLPASTLGERSLAWLDRAFVSGRVPRGTVELHGPTRSFPFRRGDGEFVVKAFVEDLTFHYQPGWMTATGLSGSVEFRNEGMSAHGITARVGELQIAEVSGEIADFKAGILKVAATATGDLSAALGFLQSSPVGELLGAQFKALQGQGVVHSNVKLLLPFANVQNRRLSVATKLTDATVRLGDLNAQVTQLNGSLIVRQSLPVEADLNGQWLGGSLDVRVTPDDQSDSNATLIAHGHAAAEKLAAFLPASVQLNGAMDWRLKTHLTSTGPSLQQFAIDSSTHGLGVELPHPVGKSVESTRSLHVDLERGERQILARAAFGDMRALVRLQPTRGKWGFDRGSVRADAVAAALPDHEGLRIEGSVDRLRLDDWFALRASPRSVGQNVGSSGGRVADFLRAANLRVGVLQLYGYEWPDVRGVMQATPAGWRVDVTGANAEGQVVIPEDFKGSQPLTIDMERLVVMRTEGLNRQANDAENRRDPREWPSLRVHIGDMHIENHPIGGVDVATTRVSEGMRIDALAIAQDAVQAEASGAWLMTAEGERSSLSAKITSTDVRATLRALNYTEFLEAKLAEVSAELAWAGGFDGNLVKRASGTITIAADSGQLLTLQPGAGRVLGLFSVAALPRRLSLDFSDLTEKGLSFDTIHGDFELREGNAYTSNLLLRGPAAEIGIAGRTGLGSQDFDQTAVVTGNLGASIPVAGVLAGGPAIGAALLLFSQVFKEPLKGIARGYYRITGTWDEPVVERVDAAEAKESKPVG